MNEYIILLRYTNGEHGWLVYQNKAQAIRESGDYNRNDNIEHVSLYHAEMLSILDSSSIAYLAPKEG